MNPFPWTSDDLRQMKGLGITPEEASRQLELFRHPPPFIRLERPATLGDGILLPPPQTLSAAIHAYEEARRKGRFLKFVPASGAASRMFHLLVRYAQRENWTKEDLRREWAEGDQESGRVLSFLEAIPQSVFWEDLKEVLVRSGRDPDGILREGRYPEMLKALLFSDGLNYSGKPKGLVKFHAYPEGARTPLAEHLVEAAHYVGDDRGCSRLHFTVSGEHMEECRKHFESLMKDLGKRHGVSFEAAFSVQKDSTHTLAVDEQNRPFRDGEGRLVFRPGGHGALIENLSELEADLVFIKNIDNVVSEPHLAPTVHWKKVLGGFLAMMQKKVFDCLEVLERGNPGEGELERMEAFAREELFLLRMQGKEGPPARRADALRRALDRPLRVCGVVKNTGEPGGGPFWVKGADGSLSLQIVESAQVDMTDRSQKEIFDRSTHFNPVDLACALRDFKGRPFDLALFMDPAAVFISRKAFQGRALKALERPGLWNGAMAGWITLFLEVPLETFNPVKTVFDLMKAAHR
jgi:Domain of unknown function (DUF4301)